MAKTKTEAKKTTRTRREATAVKKSAEKTGGAKSRSTKKAEALSADAEKTVTVDRRAANGRRMGEERRKNSVPVAVERRKIERRVKVSRRRQIDPTTCERDYTIEEIEFMSALDEYKRTSGRMFPTCSEILEVLRNLGYAKHPVLEATDLSESNREQDAQEQDGQEAHDTELPESDPDGTVEIEATEFEIEATAV